MKDWKQTVIKCIIIENWNESIKSFDKSQVKLHLKFSTSL